MNTLNYIDIFEKDFSFRIADSVFTDNLKSQYHTHNFYEFFLVRKGNLMHIINNNVYQITKGTLCFILPDDSHSFEVKEGGSEATITNVAFTHNEYQLALSYLQYNGLVQIPDSERQVNIDGSTLIAICERFDEIYKLTGIPVRNQLHSTFRVLLIEILLLFVRNTLRAKTLAPNWLTTACEQMKMPQNFREGIPRFVELSRRTQEHLTRLLKKHEGITPSEFVNHNRLMEASRLLRNTSKTIGEILTETGFENSSYFNRLFKACYGQSPLNYRFSNDQIVNPTNINK